MPDVPLPKPSAPVPPTPPVAPSAPPTPGSQPITSPAPAANEAAPPPSARVSMPPLPTPPPAAKPPVAPPPMMPKPGLAPVPPAPGAPAPPPLPPKGPVPANIAEKPAPTPAAPAQQPIMATIKSNPMRFLPFALGALLIVGAVGFLINYFLRGSSSSATPSASTAPTASNRPAATSTTLTYWGLWEPSDVLDDVLKDFEAQNPGVKVQYVKQSHVDYRERLQTAIASQNGPDVFRYHASWVPMLKSELATLPSSVMSTAEYQQTFYPIAFQQLQVNGQIVGLPLMYDGLALYYNKAHLQAANAQPPETWAELKTLASQLTIRSSDNSLERGGLAIGNSANVEHFADIIGLLMLQNGADPTQPTTKAATEALTFYTNFYTKDKVWDETLPSSTVAFARGEASMMFAPSWRALEVKATNPELEFGIAPVPKLGTEKITWGSYWAEGVNSKAKNKDAGWKLLKYLSSKDVQQKLYSAQAQVRPFGEPYSRVDLASSLATDQYVGAYLEDAPNAKSWYLNTYTHDNGINDLIIKYYRDAVNAVIAGTKDASEAMATVEQGTQQILRQYGVTK